MLKLFIRLSILWCVTASPLHAQQVIDPLEKTVNAKVETVSSLVTINNEVYFVAELSGASTPTVLMKFNPTNQQFSKVADVPDEIQLHSTYTTDNNSPGGIIPIRNLLLMPNFRQWFDPASKTFKSTFATQRPSFKARCKLVLDKDLLLACNDYLANEEQQQYYRLNKTDLLFYQTDAHPSGFGWYI